MSQLTPMVPPTRLASWKMAWPSSMNFFVSAAQSCSSRDE